jgi:NTE family protein
VPRADLVLEGGGVKGLGTVGAVLALLDAGYEFPRVAGTSVGALAAAFVATGVDADGLEAVLARFDLRRIPDRRLPVPLLGEGWSLLTGRGAFEGDYVQDWVEGELARLGVRTFGDLRRDDAGDDESLPSEHRYKLVVTVTDVTHGRLLRLPWDYHLFNLPPDEQSVAEAVRMSLSIPLYFRPCTLRDPLRGTTATIVDGGVLSNFPVEIFDRTDGRPSRWPTFGVRLMPDLPAGLGALFPGLALPTLPPVRLVYEVIATALVGRDQTHLDRPGVRGRTMTVDTSGTGIVEFGIGGAERQALLDRGRREGRRFLAARVRSDDGDE